MAALDADGGAQQAGQSLTDLLATARQATTSKSRYPPSTLACVHAEHGRTSDAGALLDPPTA